MDVSVTMMMKNAVKCDNNCDMQPLVNHHIFERGTWKHLLDGGGSREHQRPVHL
jgi:hypothetical protein